MGAQTLLADGAAADHSAPMLRMTPILLAVLYGLAMYHFSARRTRRVMAENSTPLDDPDLAAVTERLRQTLDLPQLTVFLYDIAPVNGFAGADGRVYLTRGFYEAFRTGQITAEEVASVIAHELGHLALGHTRRRIIDFSGQNAVRTVLVMLLSRILPGIGVWIANMLTAMLAARLSRSDEFEADEYATALMIKSGLGAGPQKSLFGKLNHLTGNPGASVPAWLLSHPDAKDRIAAITRNEEKWRQV